MDNQKNSQRGSTLHHHALQHNPTHCPVKALARRVIRLRSVTHDPNITISCFAPDQHVQPADITRSLRIIARDLGLYTAGYSPDRISSHSLRASGAMALKLAGHDSITIKKMGRWSSDTFLMYIHSQIACLSAGLSADMALPRMFSNIGGD